MDRDALSGAHPRHLGSDLGDLAREFVAGNKRFTDQEIAIPSLEVIVQVGAADAARPHPDQNAIWRHRRCRVLLKA
jgi:hypothetical protein